MHAQHIPAHDDSRARTRLPPRRLDSAESPAEVLGSLCERLRFSPEAALDLHRSLYKVRMHICAKATAARGRLRCAGQGAWYSWGMAAVAHAACCMGLPRAL